VASCTRSVSYSKSNQSCIVYIRLLCFAVTEQLDMNIKSKKKVKVRQSIMYGAVTLCLTQSFLGMKDQVAGFGPFYILLIVIH